MKKLLLLCCLLACDVRPIVPGGPSHDITIESSGSDVHFFNRRTSKTFIPRGNNIVGTIPHTLLDVGVFDPVAMDGRLKKMHEVGYNTVRIWLDHRLGGVGNNATGVGLNPDYIHNISVFLGLADRYDIYVIFTLDWLPGVEPYQSLTYSAGDDYTNHEVTYLSGPGVEADVKFWGDFCTEMRGLPRVNRIFAYELRNEFYFVDGEKPFDRDASGNYFRVITTGDGNTYDLSDPAQVQNAMINNMNNYFTKVKDAIKSVDPNSLVTCGLIVTKDPNMGRGDLAVDAGILDFYDLHIYPHEFYNTLTEYMTDYGLDGNESTPILIGEYGARREAADYTRHTFAGYNALYGPEADWFAAQDMIAWQTQMCQYGVDGWLLWDYDSQDAFFDAIANRGLGDHIGEPVVIPVGTTPGPGPWYGYTGYLLSPAVRPDPCSPDAKIPVSKP